MTKRERGLWGFLSSALPFIMSWGVWNFNKSWWWKVKLKHLRVCDKQKRKSEGGGKTEGCVVWGICFVSWGKKRSEERQIRGQCLSGLLKLCLMSGGFCGFFSMHVLWLYLVPSYGRSSWVRRFDHFSCFTRPINKWHVSKVRVFLVIWEKCRGCLRYRILYMGLRGLFVLAGLVRWFYFLSSVLDVISSFFLFIYFLNMILLLGCV